MSICSVTYVVLVPFKEMVCDVEGSHGVWERPYRRMQTEIRPGLVGRASVQIVVDFSVRVHVLGGKVRKKSLYNPPRQIVVQNSVADTNISNVADNQVPVRSTWFTCILYMVCICTWFTCILYMVYMYFVHGLRVFCTWFTCILYMVYIYFVHGLHVFCTWFTCILYMVYMYFVHGLHIFCTWFTCILYMVYMYFVHGLRVFCTWFTLTTVFLL